MARHLLGPQLLLPARLDLSRRTGWLAGQLGWVTPRAVRFLCSGRTNRLAGQHEEQELSKATAEIERKLEVAG